MYQYIFFLSVLFYRVIINTKFANISLKLQYVYVYVCVYM